MREKMLTNNFLFIIVLTQLTLGKGSKSGPINKRTQSSMKTETTVVMSVLQPELSCTAERDKDVEMGSEEKKQPNRLLEPWARNSCEGWIL